ncbi:MAG: hypothetical protein OXI87_04570 [Albidovulum sp.]|nr:hypothetical protein [Albidovulum sp.]
MSEQSKISKGVAWIVGAISVVFALAFALSVTALTVLATGPVEAPEWLKSRVENKLEALLGTDSLDIEHLELSFDLNFLAPAAHFHGIKVLGAQGEIVTAFSAATAEFDLKQLIAGQLIPRSLRIPHLRLDLVQEIDGSLALAVRPLGTDGGTGLVASNSFFDVVNLFRGGELAFLDSIEIEEVELEIQNLALDRSWFVERGKLKVERFDSSISGQMTFRISGDESPAALASIEFISEEGAREILINGSLSGARANELPLGDEFKEHAIRLDAPIVAEARAKMKDDGKIEDINASLRVLEGTYSYADDKTIFVDGAEFDFVVDPLSSRVDFSRIFVETEILKLSGKGYAIVPPISESKPRYIVGGLEYFDSEFAWPEQFDSPISEVSGQMSFRIGNSPQAIEFFGTVVDSKSNRFSTDGKLALTADGLSASLAASSQTLSLERIIELWPNKIAPTAREWAKGRIVGGLASDLHGAVVIEPAQRTKAGLTWRFLLDEAKYAKDLPPISGAAGYGELTADGFAVVFENGRIRIPDNGSINIAETSFSVLDYRAKKRRASAEVRFGGEFKSIFAFLDYDPINFLQNAGISSDFATGQAQGKAKLDFPIRTNLSTSDFRVAASGTASRVYVSDVARGRSFSADLLEFKVTDMDISVSGNGSFGRIPVSGTWTKSFGEDADGESLLAGNFPLSASAIKEFGVELPNDSAVGEQTANFTVEFAGDANPQIVLSTRLDKFTLSVPALGWLKPQGQRGQLTVISEIADGGSLDRFDLETDGLSARGHMLFDGAGELKRAEFSRLRVGKWLDAPVSIGQVDGRISIQVNGGELDLRHFEFGSGTGMPETKSPISLNLDKLIYSDKIVLTDVQGSIVTGEAIEGRLRGLVNGKEEIELALSGSRHGTRVDATAQNAGAALAAAGVLDNLYGGQIQVRFTPSENESEYRGQFKISNVRAVEMPLLGAILDLISVVGLLQKLAGEGIQFQTIEGDFKMVDSGIIFRDGSATGPSIGLTFGGGVNTEQSLINISGVITPIYLLNGILEQMEFVPKIFGKKKGEGVFAFNYEIKGDSRQPQITVNPVSGLLPGFLRDLLSSVAAPSSR